MSEGLAAGEIIDILESPTRTDPRSRCSPTSSSTRSRAKTEHPNVQVRLLEKLLKDEISSRRRTNQTQAKLFSEQIDAVLHRYELRQITSAEVVERLVEIAKSLRDARRRHEQLGLTVEEAAFYDALAGGVETSSATRSSPRSRAELVKSIRADLTVDWADRESTEAAIRRKIKRLLRQHKYDHRCQRAAVATGLAQPLHRARARPGQGALPLLARRRGDGCLSSAPGVTTASSMLRGLFDLAQPFPAGPERRKLFLLLPCDFAAKRAPTEHCVSAITFDDVNRRMLAPS